MEVWAAARVRAHVWETETVFVTRDTRASCVRTVPTGYYRENSSNHTQPPCSGNRHDAETSDHLCDL